MTIKPDFEEMAEKWCVCAEDYTLRGRTDPECRCDVWEEAIEAAYMAGRELQVEIAHQLMQRGVIPPSAFDAIRDGVIK